MRIKIYRKGILKSIYFEKFKVSLIIKRKQCILFADGVMKTVAMYDPENRILNFNCSQCERVAWKGNWYRQHQYKLFLWYIDPLCQWFCSMVITHARTLWGFMFFFLVFCFMLNFR